MATENERRPVAREAARAATPAGAVFLSYASEDAAVAEQLAAALRNAGIEVWFDKSELRGGDAWDQSIRKQIKSCALFIPVISHATHNRREGYFRLEWKLAVDRSQLMDAELAFLLPVVIDDTRDDDERVPARFREVQWTRLSGGETSPTFVERVRRLLAPETSDPRPGPARQELAFPMGPTASRRGLLSRGWRPAFWAIGVVFVVALAYFVADKFWISRHAEHAPESLASDASPSNAAAPEKSIAVLPFVNMSADKEQDYFSDGLTEEMIELLSQVPDLRVPARTSSFYFKGKNESIANIARQLKVAHVLEGSVRKAGKRLRITAQLIRADNGYHMWSQAYDRDDTDVFAVQDDIAKAVVDVLQIKLVGGVQETGSRGTTSTEAYNQYLLGSQLRSRGTVEDYRHAAEAFSKAIALDPNYAAAYAGRAEAEAALIDFTGDRSGYERVQHDIEKAIALAPADANGYAARSRFRTFWLRDWSGAQADIEKALILEPRNSHVQHRYAQVLETLDRLPEAIAAQKKAIELDPLSSIDWDYLGALYTEIGDFAQADAALVRALEIAPTSAYGLDDLNTLRLLQGKNHEALEAAQKIDQEGLRLTGIAMAEQALGNTKASQQALEELIEKHAQDSAYQIAEVFTWRGEKDRAFEWLERAYKQQAGELSGIKSDPLLKSLHADPRFNALLRKMNLPE